MRIDRIGKYIPIRKGFPKVYRYQKDGNDYFLVDGRSKTWGLTIRKNFNIKDDAMKFAQEIEDQILENGKNVSNNQIYQDKEIERLDAKLKPFGKTLSEAVEFFVESMQEAMKKAVIPPIKDLCLKWHDEKANNKLDPLRKRTRTEYKSYCKYIASKLGAFKPGDISKKQIQSILTNIAGEQLTRKKYLQYLKNFFNWCVENEYVLANPTQGVRIKIVRKDIVLYSPDEVEKLLRLCETKYPALLGYYCLCVFGGLRPSEAERARWDDFHFEGKEVFVNSESKTGRRRFVLKDTDTLWIWLTHIKTLRGDEPLNPKVNHQGLQKKVRKDFGLPWTQDVLRHTFGTNYYNLHRDLDQVSHDMGNSNEVCKNHYVREVKRADRDKFWGLRPQA